MSPSPQAARCDCCRSQGVLRERVQWRGEMKHFCDQHCLLRFYCQQNEPNMATQKGPENLQYGASAARPARGPGGVPLRTLLSFKKLTPVEEVESSRGWQEAEQNDNKVSEKSTRLVCAVWGGTAEPLGDGASSQAPSEGRAARAACALPGGRGTNGAGATCLALYFSSPV